MSYGDLLFWRAVLDCSSLRFGNLVWFGGFTGLLGFGERVFRYLKGTTWRWTTRAEWEVSEGRDRWVECFQVVRENNWSVAIGSDCKRSSIQKGKPRTRWESIEFRVENMVFLHFDNMWKDFTILSHKTMSEHWFFNSDQH